MLVSIELHACTKKYVVQKKISSHLKRAFWEIIEPNRKGLGVQEVNVIPKYAALIQIVSTYKILMLKIIKKVIQVY